MLERERTKAVMAKYGVSQNDVAGKMGVPQARVSVLVRGGADIAISTFKKFCEAIGCKAEELW